MLPFHLSHAPRRGSWCERVFIVGPFSGPYSDCTWKSSDGEFPGVTHKGLSGCSLYHSYEFYLGLATNKSLAILSSARVHSFTVLRIWSGLTCASFWLCEQARARDPREARHGFCPICLCVLCSSVDADSGCMTLGRSADAVRSLSHSVLSTGTLGCMCTCALGSTVGSGSDCLTLG